MSDLEKWANLILHELNEAQSTGRMDPGEYRRRRRDLLQSIALHGGATTSRRRSAAGDPSTPVSTPTHHARRRRPVLQAAARSRTLRLWCAAMLVGAALVYWHSAPGA